VPTDSMLLTLNANQVYQIFDMITKYLNRKWDIYFSDVPRLIGW